MNLTHKFKVNFEGTLRPVGYSAAKLLLFLFFFTLVSETIE